MGDKPKKSSPKLPKTKQASKKPAPRRSPKVSLTGRLRSSSAIANSGVVPLAELPMPALLLDKKTLRILECNHSANSLYDRSTSEMLASTLFDLTLPVEHAALRQSFDTPTDHVKELHQLRRNGTVI